MKSSTPKPTALTRGERAGEVARFVVNGLFATGVHFSVLTFALGNRYFVFRGHTDTILSQAPRFAGVYVTIGLLHAGVLLVLTDWLKIDFRIGFLVATCLQVAISYVGNRRLVFAR